MTNPKRFNFGTTSVVNSEMLSNADWGVSPAYVNSHFNGVVKDVLARAYKHTNRPLHILDVGAGTCLLAHWLDQNRPSAVASYTALECQPARLKIGEKRFPKRSWEQKFIVGLDDKVPHMERHFDLIIASGVTPYLSKTSRPDWSLFKRFVRNLTSSGSWVVFDCWHRPPWYYEYPVNNGELDEYEYTLPIEIAVYDDAKYTHAVAAACTRRHVVEPPKFFRADKLDRPDAFFLLVARPTAKG